MRLILFVLAVAAVGQVQAGPCDGRFNFDLNGSISGALDLYVQGTGPGREYLSGQISLAGQGTQNVRGICIYGPNEVRIDFTRYWPGGQERFVGAVTSSWGSTDMRGQIVGAPSYVYWRASRGSSGNPGFPNGNSICAGLFDINLNGMGGQMNLSIDVNGNLSGGMSLVGKPAYPVSGRCDTQPDGRIFIHLSSNSPGFVINLDGTVYVWGQGVRMDGQWFSGGHWHSWSATRP